MIEYFKLFSSDNIYSLHKPYFCALNSRIIVMSDNLVIVLNSYEKV